jgi:Sigma-70, region 4
VKIGICPIDEISYKKELYKAIRKFQAGLNRIEKHYRSRIFKTNSIYSRLLTVLKESPAPLTATEIITIAGLPLPDHKYGSKGRLAIERLEYRGWVQKCDRTIRYINTRSNSMRRARIWTFKISNGPTALLEKSKAQLSRAFVSKVEKLNYRRALGSCMTARIKLVNRQASCRDFEIVNARLQGKLLEDIGKDYDLTRERVRQIVEKAVRK